MAIESIVPGAALVLGEVRQVTSWLRDNPAAAFAGIGAVLLLGYYAFAWVRVGRDPPRGTIVPLSTPPPRMSAASVRYVHRMEFDERVFTAAILDLAVNGHIKLVASGETMEMQLREGGNTVEPAVMEAKAKLLGSDQSVTINYANRERLWAAQSALNGALERTYLDQLFTDNREWSVLGLFATILFVGALAITVGSTHGERGNGIVLGMLVPLIPLMVAATMARIGWRRAQEGDWFMVGGIALAAISIGVGFYLMSDHARGFVEVLPAVAAFIVAPVAAAAFGWLRAPSKAGREILDRVEGFRQYLGAAQEQREALQPAEKTPELFERFLPYAVALDLEQAWASRFSAVLAKAARGAPAGHGREEVFYWYWDDSDDSDPGSFASTIGDDLSETIAAASVAPETAKSSDETGSGGSRSSSDSPSSPDSPSSDGGDPSNSSDSPTSPDTSSSDSSDSRNSSSGSGGQGGSS